MAFLQATGFELDLTSTNGEFTVLGTGQTITGTVTSGAPRTGSWAGKISGMTSATQSGFLFKWLASTAAGPFYLQVPIYVHTRPSASNHIISLNGASGSVGSTPRSKITLESNGTLILRNAAGTAIGSPSAVLTNDTWYIIEILHNAANAGATDVLEARLAIDDGSTVPSVFATSSVQTLSNVFAYSIGGNLDAEAQTTGEWYFDDVVLRDDAYPGLRKLGFMVPDSAGDVNTFATQTGGTAGSGNNFTRVNEIPADDATTFNGSSTLNEHDLFNMGASGTGSGDTINAVFVGGRFRNSVADVTAAIKFEIEKAAAGTIVQSAAFVPNSTTWTSNDIAVPRNFPIIRTTDPDGAAWTGGTGGTLDSMQVGYKLTTAPGTAGRRIDVTGVWVYFDYTPSSSVSASITQVAATLTATGGTQTVATVSNSAIAQLAATLTAAGGTQVVASVNNVSIAQLAATLTAAGGTQTVVSVSSAAIAQVAANITATGGTQVPVTLQNASITQVAATLTATGGIQVVAAVQLVSIAQVAANITATGGTQTVVSVSFAAITQVAATLTATGGTQVVAATSTANASIAQLAANITATGGTQVIAAVRIVAIAQIAGNLTATGGTQSLSTINNVAISQIAAILTATGGTQVVSSVQKVAIAQLAGNITASGGTQGVSAGVFVSVAISQVAATLTATGGTPQVSITTGPPLKFPTQWSDNDIKLPAVWSQALKNGTLWTNHINKNPTAYTPVLKTSSIWFNESVVQVSYLYDDPTMTYDSGVRGYDYLTPQANQLNNRKPTLWSAR